MGDAENGRFRVRTSIVCGNEEGFEVAIGFTV